MNRRGVEGVVGTSINVYTHKERAANVESHKFASTALNLDPGRHQWMDHAPDPVFFVPLSTSQ
jgi:hypothetical protein